jgi:hypothetical protein
MADLKDMQTVKFPRAVDVGEVEKMLGYLATNLPANISITVKQQKTVQQGERLETTSCEIGGTISQIGSAYDSFACNPSKKDLARFDSFRFQPILDFNLNDYNEENVALWADTRNKVDEYFASNQS